MMMVVIFRAKVRAQDEAYAQTSARLRELALTRYGCLNLHAVSQGDEEIAVSLWPSMQHIEAWRNDAEHALAQHLGRDRWYASYAVQIAEVNHTHEWRASSCA